MLFPFVFGGIFALEDSLEAWEIFFFCGFLLGFLRARLRVLSLHKRDTIAFFFLQSTSSFPVEIFFCLFLLRNLETANFCV